MKQGAAFAAALFREFVMKMKNVNCHTNWKTFPECFRRGYTALLAVTLVPVSNGFCYTGSTGGLCMIRLFCGTCSVIK